MTLSYQVDHFSKAERSMHEEPDAKNVETKVISKNYKLPTGAKNINSYVQTIIYFSNNFDWYCIGSMRDKRCTCCKNTEISMKQSART